MASPDVKPVQSDSVPQGSHIIRLECAFSVPFKCILCVICLYIVSPLLTFDFFLSYFILNMGLLMSFSTPPSNIGLFVTCVAFWLFCHNYESTNLSIRSFENYITR